MSQRDNYPPDAYAPDGRLWWDRKYRDGPRGTDGAKPRAASWIRFNVNPGEIFTTEGVRRALQITDEHFQRRLRELRDLVWVFDGMKDATGLNAEYRLREYGWWPGSSDPKPKTTGTIEAGTRRFVLERDGSRCLVCGVGAGEPYPEPPHASARITIGHIVPAEFGGSNRPTNLRCECARCNETVRSESGSGENSKELVKAIRNLKHGDRRILYSWLKIGHRERSDLDEVYDRIRLAAPGEREFVVEWLDERF